MKNHGVKNKAGSVGKMKLRLGGLALSLALLIGLLVSQGAPAASAADPSVTLTAIGGGGTRQLPNGAFTVTTNCQTGVFTALNEENRVALEFDLSGIPAGAEIQAASLRLRAANYNLSGTTAIYGYAGNGAIEAGDMTAGSLAVTYTPSTPSPESVDVTAAVLARWQNSQRWAGFTLRQDPLGSTYGGWDCPGYYAEPLLTITYTTPDSTPPVITPNIVGTKGTNDWYTSDVSVSWSVTDAESPVTSQTGCDTQNITADTTGVTFTCSATSAGGTSTSQPVTIKRDATKPIVASATPERAPNAAGWYNAPLKVAFDGLDATSGIASCGSPTYSGPDGASVTASATCTDNAGNISSPVSFALNYDATPPTVVSATPSPVPNAGGWYNAPVTVNFAGSDATSGLASCASPIYSGPDSATGSVEGTCTDKAGNTSSSVIFNLKYDATAPTLGPTVSPNPPSLNLPATAAPNAGDATSGVASSSCAPPDTTSAGAKNLACTATDNAGNTATAQLTYTVVNNAPTIAVAPGGSCSDDKARGSIKLTVGDANTGAGGLTLRVVSSTNTQLVPASSIVFGGSGANRTMSVAAASKKSGAAAITVGVSDGVNTTNLVVTVIVGTDKNETLNGTSGADLIFGLLGRNTINGLGSSDLLCGGNGVDTLNGGEGDDTLYGNRGDDTLTGGPGVDFFSGGQGCDTVTDFTPGQGDTKDSTVERVTTITAAGAIVTDLGAPEIVDRLFLPALHH